VLLCVFICWGKAKAKMKVKEAVPKPEALVYGSSDNTNTALDLGLHAAADGIRADELTLSSSTNERAVEYRHSDSRGAQSTSTRF